MWPTGCANHLGVNTMEHETLEHCRTWAEQKEQKLKQSRDYWRRQKRGEPTTKNLTNKEYNTSITN